MYVSVDPGVRHAGVAMWGEDKRLLRAFLVGPGEEWLAFLEDLPRDGEAIRGVMEIPQIYPGKAVRHEDLIQLAVSAGAIAGHFGGHWTQARPAVWTRATCQKKEPRLERAWRRLPVDEQARVIMPSTKLRRADVLDALALGLWWLGRW